MKEAYKFIVSLVLCFIAGLVGSVFTFSAISNWYGLLNRPSFAPPNWLFGPVWTTLYFLMGISLFLVWRKFSSEKKVGRSLILFFVHLFFNSTWSIVFFGLHQIFLALLVILVLWLMIIAVILNFYKIDKAAAYLLMPYLYWVTFASVLNYSFWLLNR